MEGARTGGRRRARRVFLPAMTLLLFCSCLLLPGCDKKPAPEVHGAYRTRDGLASLEFRPGRRYLFRHRLLDISISGNYHMADARKIFLHLPLRRADETLGPPMLLRHRDELRLYKSDGEIVHFYRERDPHDGPELLVGELPEPESAKKDADVDANDAGDGIVEEVPVYGESAN